MERRGGYTGIRTEIAGNEVTPALNPVRSKTRRTSGLLSKVRHTLVDTKACRATLAGITAVVLGAAGASCSPNEGSSSSTSSPTADYSISSTSNGIIYVNEGVENFGSLPAAVEEAEPKVFQINNAVKAKIGNKLEWVGLGGTGAIISVNGKTFGLTAGHEIAGLPAQDGMPLVQANCTEAELALAQDGKFAWGYFSPVNAATIFNPKTANENTPDIALMTLPVQRPALTLGSPPVSGEKIYLMSDQPNTPNGNALNPEFGQKPDVIAGIVLGKLPGSTNKYVVITNLGDFTNTPRSVEAGASGGPALDTRGEDEGTIIQSVDLFTLYQNQLQRERELLRYLKTTYGVNGVVFTKNANSATLSLAVIQENTPQELKPLVSLLPKSSCS